MRLSPNTEICMIRRFLALVIFTLVAAFTNAQPSLPSSFQAKTIHSPEGADIFVRWGGNGPVVVLIHGYAENRDSWAPLAADLKGPYGGGAGPPWHWTILQAC